MANSTLQTPNSSKRLPNVSSRGRIGGEDGVKVRAGERPQLFDRAGCRVVDAVVAELPPQELVHGHLVGSRHDAGRGPPRLAQSIASLRQGVFS